MIEELKKWLNDRKYNYVELRHLDDGCETCGYGATEVEEIDGEALMREIDAFVADFEDKRKQKKETN